MNSCKLIFDVSLDNSGMFSIDGGPTTLVLIFNEEVYRLFKMHQDYVKANKKTGISFVSMYVPVTVYKDEDMTEEARTETNRIRIYDDMLMFDGYFDDNSSDVYSSETLYMSQFELYHQILTCPDEELPLLLVDQSDPNMAAIAKQRLDWK